MNRTRFLAVATILLATLTALAQQSAEAPGSAGKDSQHVGMLNAEDHLRMMSEKLGLTADQQEKLRPILQNMLDERQKVMRDQNLSSEQREVKQRAIHEKAGREARKFLNDDQKKKLDELEAEHHAESSTHTPH